MHDKFLKPYSPLDTEDRIYEGWLKSGYFNPDNLPPRHKEPFSIVLPPPNVTGILHMGSALMIAIEDIMVRYARMQGKKTLWIPGTDHAAIATQSKVEKEIQKAEGKSRHDLGREEMLKRIDAFAKESHDHIVNQIKKLGASVDWSREAFTLDEQRNLAVRTVFKKMYDDGLIYRGYRVVNWDPKGQTTISDDEIVYEERKAKMYTFKYSKDFPISISTTRPETKVGDVAVAVHPEDERYTQYIGKEYDAVFAGAPIHIKIIADEKVEKEFGTGALGVTPAHSMIDYEIAQRHKLEIKPVINEYAKLTVSDFAGKKTSEARELIVEWLKSQGLLEKEEEITQNISTAERTGGIVEPLPKLQWFIDVNKKFRDGKSLKDLMLAAGEKIDILPDRYKKVYFHWIENLRDWCISRQIWYGHRVPVWYKGEEMYCGLENPGEGWVQDEDTLDTWFSSGLWTFSTLGWPDKFDTQYHPTTIIETGTDILFFWIARMIMMSEYILGEIPFKTVYLHGLVRDEKGRKISKSLGNNIDPVDMAKKYGADATRMSLIIGIGSSGSDRNGNRPIF
jgi:valyl-tRNA synthetase